MDRKTSSQCKYIGKNRYCLDKIIASGSYGKVYDCYPFAVKQIKFPNMKDNHPNLFNHIKTTLQNQINILRDVNHNNIVKLFEVLYQNQCVYLVMQHCESDLKMQIAGKIMGEKKAIKIMEQILQGCKEMVKFNVVHRDIKPANILYNKGIYKLADFGMAKYLQASSNKMLSSHVGTPYYMAPQILQRKDYSKKCDIWSLGVIFYQLIFGKLPYEGRDEKALLSNIITSKLRFPAPISTQVKDTLCKMLSISESRRLSWQQLFTNKLDIQNPPTNSKQDFYSNQIPHTHIIHRQYIEQMINIQKQRIAVFEFRTKYAYLDRQQISYVRKILESLFSQENQYILNDVFDKYPGGKIEFK